MMTGGVCDFCINLSLVLIHVSVRDMHVGFG